MTTNRPEFKAHDDFNFENKKIGKVTREEFIKYIRGSHDHMRKLSQIIQQYDQTIDDYLEEWDGRFESFDDDVKDLLGRWIQDGTMDQLINENLMSTKADKEEVESITAQLAQTATTLALVTNQRRFLQLQKDFTLTKDRSPLYKINGDRNVTFLFPTTADEYLHYRFEKDDNDDFIKMREMAIYEQGETLENYQEVTSGSMNEVSLTSINNYTTSVGTKITHTFTGKSITMRHFYDTRGGVWKVSVDGNFIKNISTHADAVSDDEKDTSGPLAFAMRKLYESDQVGVHTLELEFLGSDPDNPPSSPPARGWIYSTNGSTYEGPERTFTVIDGHPALKHTLSHNTSNKEFAFGVKPAESSFGTRWIPEHNAVGTVFIDDGYQKLMIDNREISMASTTDDYKDFQEAVMIQHLKFYHSEYLDDPLGILIMNTSIKDGVVRFTTTLKFLRDTYISGYVNMLPVMNITGDRLTTSLNNTFETVLNDGSVTPLGEDIASKEYVFTSTNPIYADYFTGVKMDDLLTTLGGNYDIGVEHRTQGFQKLYPKVLDNHIFNEGSHYTFSGTFFIGRMEEAVSFIR